MFVRKYGIKQRNAKRERGKTHISIKINKRKSVHNIRRLMKYA